MNGDNVRAISILRSIRNIALDVGSSIGASKESVIEAMGMAIGSLDRPSPAPGALPELPEPSRVASIVRKVALFNGGLIAEDLAKVEAFLANLDEAANRVYRLIPTLPVTADTLEEATRAMTQFCYDFQPLIRDVVDAAPAGSGEVSGEMVEQCRAGVDRSKEVCAFESWALAQGFHPDDFDRIEGRPANKFGLTWEYNGNFLQASWAAWMERAALQSAFADDEGVK